MKSLNNSENLSRKLIPAFRQLPVSEIIQRAACDSENCSESTLKKGRASWNSYSDVLLEQSLGLVVFSKKQT
jgi:hypothetical protein